MIGTSSSEVQGNLKLLAQERSKISITLMHEWAIRYQGKIRGFATAFNGQDLQSMLGDAYFQYMQYSFMYRFLNGLHNNILYRKILSFEIHYFTKVGLLKLERALQLTDPSDDENLFYISPLGHFLSYKLQKEFHITIANLSEVDEKNKLFDYLLYTIRTSFGDFFSSYSSEHVIPLDSFREFLNQPNNKNIEEIFRVIEKRPFEMF
ncbi:hypothetical protein LFX25_02200 [Leptospira sp. FAT2]|uniref:hypothetical protein n=1 Tax=Leptospira sanjuanensis TaxID=2879643 RepID=UPI001EE7BC5C|nr:hypothetical protein [Leptospira sanjuanensis]MCG6192054.1 hypothetical protein [Leptospira sanjuanensis]